MLGTSDHEGPIKLYNEIASLPGLAKPSFNILIIYTK